MTGEQTTEREAALAARVKELEDASAKSAVTIAQGGVFESVWRTITYSVPPWLAAVALTVFVAHYGFGYYLQAQVTPAETQLRQAKADLETAKAEAANAPDDEGVPMRLATLKAQTDKITAEAAVARASARALNTQVNGETAALQAAKAQLDKVQNEARLAEAELAAIGAKFGVSTLEERAVKAKWVIQVLKTVEQNQKAQYSAALAQGGSGHIELIGRAIVRGECLNNEFAELIGCPSQFIQHNRQQAKVDAAATAESSGAGGLRVGQTATVKAVNANLRRCPEASNRCAPLGTMPQGSAVKIIELAADDWVKVDFHDAARRGTWQGYVKSTVLNPGGEQ